MKCYTHMNHVSVGPTKGNGPTQGQRKTLTRVVPTVHGFGFAVTSHAFLTPEYVWIFNACSTRNVEPACRVYFPLPDLSRKIERDSARRVYWTWQGKHVPLAGESFVKWAGDIIIPVRKKGRPETIAKDGRIPIRREAKWAIDPWPLRAKDLIVLVLPN